jgi:hypothetical protein
MGALDWARSKVLYRLMPSLDFHERANRLYRKRRGFDGRADRGDGFSLYNHEDLNTYREIQIIANKAKLGLCFARESNLVALCNFLSVRGVKIRRVLCHGTRNGAEQKYFKRRLPSAEIVGTEISDNAEQFPMTIQWDFHEVKPKWIGAFDLIYSNSWDHTYDPAKLFPAWLSCLASGGALALEWTVEHGQDHTNVIDPFGADFPALRRLLKQYAGPEFDEPVAFDQLPERARQDTMLVIRRSR